MSIAAEIDDLGYAVVRNVMSQKFIAHAQAHVDWLLKDHSARRLGIWMVGDEIDPFWVRMADEDALIALVSQIIGPDIMLYNAYYSLKFAGDSLIPWHQDKPNMPFNPMKEIRLWVALDRVTQENGCLKVVPRSQRTDLTDRLPAQDVPEQGRFGGKYNAYAALIRSGAVSVDEQVDLLMEPGDVAIFGPLLLHASGPNRAAARRCALQLTYIPSDVRIEPQLAISASTLPTSAERLRPIALRGRPSPEAIKVPAKSINPAHFVAGS